MIDLLIVVAYFVLVMLVAISGRQTKEVTSDEYFLSSRSLRWPSIAFSTIATNIQGYQFLGTLWQQQLLPHSKLMNENAERINGWAAMLGVIAAMGSYATTGQLIPGIW